MSGAGVGGGGGKPEAQVKIDDSPITEQGTEQGTKQGTSRE